MAARAIVQSIAEVRAARARGAIRPDVAHERIVEILDSWLAQLREIRGLPTASPDIFAAGGVEQRGSSLAS